MYSRSEVDILQSFNVNTVFELDPIFICFKINRMLLNTFVLPLKIYAFVKAVRLTRSNLSETF